MTKVDVWLEGWLSGDLPESELEAFQDWLRIDPQHRRRFLTAVALDQDLRAPYRLPRILRWRPPRWMAAAVSVAALVIIAASLMLWKAAPLPTTFPAPARVVSGWTLSEELILGQAPAHDGRIPSITALQPGEMKRAGSLVQLQPGATVILSGATLDDGTNDLQLSNGRLTAGVQDVRLPKTPAPGPTSTVKDLRINTACGSILLKQGSKVELASGPLSSPEGLPGHWVEVLVVAGSVMPPDLVPMPTAPEPLTAGARIRLTRIGQEAVRMKRFSAPK
jgi:hypothetical protein